MCGEVTHKLYCKQCRKFITKFLDRWYCPGNQDDPEWRCRGSSRRQPRSTREWLDGPCSKCTNPADIVQSIEQDDQPQRFRSQFEELVDLDVDSNEERQDAGEELADELNKVKLGKRTGSVGSGNRETDQKTRSSTCSEPRGKRRRVLSPTISQERWTEESVKWRLRSTPRAEEDRIKSPSRKPSPSNTAVKRDEADDDDETDWADGVL
ncbi:hypothetical protein MRB53_036856 [Persea americana]|nr:hypothetical protein MRB53_036856 [Persea americana]